MTEIPKTISAYMARIGSKGGAAGKGKPKKRSRADYVAMGKKSGAARRKKAKLK